VKLARGDKKCQLESLCRTGVRRCPGICKRQAKSGHLSLGNSLACSSQCATHYKDSMVALSIRIFDFELSSCESGKGAEMQLRYERILCVTLGALESDFLEE
jgi:hypothetical protein